MRLDTKLRDVATGGVMEVARATVKASPRVFSFFSDNIYANKFVAITRELAANAVDSHVMAGCRERPIEIWLPTELDPTYRVRDQGLGMSHDFMMNNFMAYSDASTKDGDNLAIGGFGIGSKSPFAYTDQYTIRSVYEGTVSVYSIFKDEEGIPAIALLAQKSTSEQNGVEVSFPVELGDAQQFEDAAFSTLRYFEPLPVVHNAFKGAFSPPEYLSRGETWGMRPTGGELNIIMGGVLYPCSTSSLSFELRNDQKISTLLGYGLDLRLPIGSCDIALSREALSYTPRTSEAVKAGLLAAVDEISSSFSTMFDHHETLWSAKQALCEEIGLGAYRYGGYSSRGKFLEKNAFYRGEKLDPYVQTPSMTFWEIESRSGRRSASSFNSAKWDVSSLRLAPSQVELIIVDDLPVSPRSRVPAKVRNYVQDNCDRKSSIYVVRPEDMSAQQLIEAMGNPPHILTSSLPEPVVEARARVERPHVRLFTYDGREVEEDTTYGFSSSKRIGNLNPGPDGYAGKRKGVREIPHAEQPSVGIIVELVAFELPEGIHDKMKTGLVSWSELFFANAVDAQKLKQTWRTFEDVWNERLKKALEEDPKLPNKLAVSDDGSLKKYFNFLINNKIHDKLTPRQRRTPFGRVCEAFENYVKPLSHQQRRLAQFVEPKAPRGFDAARITANIPEKVDQMIELIGHRSNYSHLILEVI